MPDLVIVGAGPVGSLLALTLAQRGYSIEMYERRPDMRRVDLSAGRSINLAVSTRGLHALHEVGLDADVLRQAVPMRGRMTHAIDGKLALLPYGQSDREHINSMSRGELNKLLMTRAEETGRVRIHFGQRLVAYDCDRKIARLEPGGEVRAEVIVGSDGSASALRDSLGGAVAQEDLSSGYRELTMPPKDGGFGLHQEALHIWPRGNFMLIALPNRDGSFTCTLFLPFEGSPSFAELRTEVEAHAFFERHFPDAVPLIPALAQQFMRAPLGRMSTVKAWPWSRGSALLIGDAAHAIVPFFGQGMNAGFEDVTLLSGMLTGGWTGDFAQFAKARKPDTDAIADLAVENFVEMCDKVADPQFLRMREIEHELQDRMPGRYLTRYQLVTFTRIPYRIALEAGEVQARLLADLALQPEPDYERGIRAAEEKLVPLLRAHGIA
ncbi:MAG TPA: NAD(P)/FAD-dependent oxidoreductase [Myxococcales bacterium]|nr:NAD(P)/FAD-dependent oxidoreductase [Myxococcales bacterium]